MQGQGTLQAASNLPIHWIGPDISKGPLPAFFYFALSGHDSLHLDPYNQPVVFLKDSPIRCFSFTIPFHGPGYDNQKAMDLWGQEFLKAPQFLDIFFDQCLRNIDYLIEQNILDIKKIAVGGLSRGGFIATHLAARDPRIKYVVGFAPMTKLRVLEELQDADHKWDLIDQTPQLTHAKIRYYIGNRDLRVGTKDCFDFIEKMTEEMFNNGQRSPPAELIINPSVGYKGHGTLSPVFKEGALWIENQLLHASSSK